MRRKLKKLTSVCLAVIMIVSVLTIAPFTAGAAESDNQSVSATITDFEYYLYDDGTALIYGYIGNDTEIIIPSEIDGYTVTVIGTWAFQNCTSLTSVTIPDSVTEIGMWAFQNCTSLTSVTIPDSVTEISEYAFQDCVSLTKVAIPDSITEIRKDVFSGCSSLESVTIPDSITYIDRYAFFNCPKLKSVTIPDKVAFIEEYAFGYVLAENGWEYKPVDGFTVYGYTNSLAGLYAYENNFNFASLGEVSPFMYEALDDETAKIIQYNGLESNMSIPSEIDGYTIVEIDQFAFRDCTRLTSVTIPDSVEVIGTYAFSGCTNITSITIPDSVTFIGYCAFENTAWYDSQPDGVVYIGNFAYTYKGEMPENTSITIKDGTKGIASYAFSFSGYSLTNVIIPDSVIYICSFAFLDCRNIESITIPNGVKEISDNVFQYCESLKNIIIPDSVTKIGYGAFAGCTNLTSVTIPDSVTEIGSNAFNDCFYFENLTIPDSVTKIGEDAFDNTAWYNNQPDGVVYAGKVAYFYKGDMPENTSLTFVDGTRGIADGAFKYWTAIASVTISDSVSVIGNNAFLYCTGLESITIPNGVTEIGDFAFSDCTNLTSVTISDSVESIGWEAFFRCPKLESITIPNSVEYIGDNAFGYIWDENKRRIKPIDGFTIYGYTGSLAEEYAVENGFIFISLGDAPTQSLGDVNGDGIISIDDATDIQKYLANVITFSNEQTSIADVDSDGEVNILDVTLIQKHLAGMVTI